MYEIAPGSILQRMHITNQIKKLQKKLNKKQLRFCEIGTGKGANSNLLLNLGLEGVGFELNSGACSHNKANNGEFINKGLYSIRNENFFDLDASQEEPFDIVFSCMVIEHLPEELVEQYFNKCTEVLAPNGRAITLVPASMKHWGVEDDIAGHFKRYSFDCFEQISQKYNLTLEQNVGLTYPLSNCILPLSNYLVNKSENNKKDLTMQERTELSGNRDVKFKTIYPWYLKILLNEITMLPFFWLQNIFKKNTNSLVIYSELSIKK
jgi:SAM-dependent methyltransferase